jgi:hypothetical protein
MATRTAEPTSRLRFLHRIASAIDASLSLIVCASYDTSGRAASSPAEEREVDFVDAVMQDVQDNWRKLSRPNSWCRK